MPDIAERYNRMVITIASPDGNVKGTLTGARRFSFTVDAEKFRDYSPESLELQAGIVISRLNAGVNVGARRILTAGGAEPIDGDKHWDARYRRYHEELARASGVGYSHSRRVKVSIAGTSATVAVRPGRFRELTAATFCTELTEAAIYARHHRQRRIVELKDKYFQLRLPIRSAE